MSYKSIGAIILALAALVLVIGAVFVGGCVSINEQPSAPVATATPAPAPVVVAPAPAPAVVTTIPMDFEVSSTTTATGHYQVMTYGDVILFCPNIEMWDSIYPGNWYHADVVANGDGTYNVVDITLTSNGYNGNVVYYYDGGQSLCRFRWICTPDCLQRSSREGLRPRSYTPGVSGSNDPHVPSGGGISNPPQVTTPTHHAVTPHSTPVPTVVLTPVPTPVPTVAPTPAPTPRPPPVPTILRS